MGGAAEEGCPKEPKWKEIYPRVPPENSPPEELDAARIYFASEGIICEKLKYVPTGCHGCEFNPAEKKSRDDQALIDTWGDQLQMTSELFDAVEMGFIKDLGTLSMDEFEMLRCWRNAVESSRMRMF